MKITRLGDILYYGVLYMMIQVVVGCVGLGHKAAAGVDADAGADGQVLQGQGYGTGARKGKALVCLGFADIDDSGCNGW